MKGPERTRVEGRNGLWTFAFSKSVKHGKGKRTVTIDVPVLQILELADQFRACPGPPAHAVYHLQRQGGKDPLPPTCPPGHCRVYLHHCSACGCTARNIDMDGRIRCPTCYEPNPKRVEEVPASPAHDLKRAIALLGDLLAADAARDHVHGAELTDNPGLAATECPWCAADAFVGTVEASA